MKLVLGFLAILIATPQFVEAQTRRCYIGPDGRRECYVDPGNGGGHRPPSVRPNPPHRPPHHQPPVVRPSPPHRPPHYQPPVVRPNPPHRPPHHQPPVIVRPVPRPPHYQPPVYRPPVTRPSWDYRRAEQLAWEIEFATNQTLQTASREAQYYNDPNQNWAVDKIWDMLLEAQTLSAQIRSYRQSASYTAYNYRSLKRAFEDAREALYWGNFSYQVEQEFDRVERAMLSLDHVYWGY